MSSYDRRLKSYDKHVSASRYDDEWSGGYNTFRFRKLKGTYWSYPWIWRDELDFEKPAKATAILTF